MLGKEVPLSIDGVGEELIINTMVAAETMEGHNGNTSLAIPHDKLIDVLKKYNAYN